MSFIRAQSILTVLLFAVSWAAPQQLPEVPRLTQRVTDLAGLLSSSEVEKLEARLAAFEDSTSTQIAVLIIPALGGTPIEEYSMRVFEKNGIGRKTKDNGVLILVARDERRLRIEVGYGLEGVLTDALSAQVMERFIKPNFREGRYAEGLMAGVDAIMAITAGEFTAEQKGPDFGSAFPLVFVLLFLLLRMLVGGNRRRRMLPGAGWTHTGGWHSSGGFWGSGGFGGGGWGGGGGLGGGGGASGRW
jgi:uncharacterized protein